MADGLRRRHCLLVVECMPEWQDGAFLGKDDSDCLLEAAAQHLALVTYDRRTIPPLLKIWAEEGRRHGGVIFVDEKTISTAGHRRSGFVHCSGCLTKPENGIGPIAFAIFGNPRL